MKHIAILAGAAALALPLLWGCSRGNQWTLDARPGEAWAGRTAVMEEACYGKWEPVDTLTFDADGRAVGRWERPATPAIMRLTALGPDAPAALFFPVDSTEQVAIGRDGRLSGSVSAEMLTRVDSLLAAGAPKREIAQAVLEEPWSIGAYYTVTRTVNGRPLFDPAADRADRRVVGAVANAYATHRPADPHTAWLKELYLATRPAATDTVQAALVGCFAVEGHTQAGTAASLAETMRGARLTLLSFAPADAEMWPAVNLALAEQARKPGVKVFQMTVGADEAAWRQAAANLPWPCVWSNVYSPAPALASYNVQQLPTTFVIDAGGTVVERVENIGDLSSAVARHL